MDFGFPEPFFQQTLLPPTIVYLIRHGEPELDMLNCYYGQMDVLLGDKGKCQSSEIVDRLERIPFEAIYSSDLQRACYLANLLGERKNLPVRCLKVFRERHMGTMQGKTDAEMESQSRELYHAWRVNRVLHRIPGAENFEDVRDRVLPAVRELIRAYAGKRIALVCHAGPIRVILAEALGMPLNHIFRLGVNHCSVHVVEYPREQAPRVTLLNG